MTKLGVFYFMAQQEIQFLTGCPISYKDWKELFFFVYYPTYFDFFSLNGYTLYSLNPLLPATEQREDYKSVI